MGAQDSFLLSRRERCRVSYIIIEDYDERPYAGLFPQEEQGLYCVRCGSGAGETHKFCQCDEPRWDDWLVPEDGQFLNALSHRNYRVIAPANYRYQGDGNL